MPGRVVWQLLQWIGAADGVGDEGSRAKGRWRAGQATDAAEDLRSSSVLKSSHKEG